MQTQDFLKNLWRWKCGLPEVDGVSKQIPSVNELRKSEWSPRFEELMRNRLLMGAYRYGVMGHNGVRPKGKPMYDRCESIRQRLLRYEQSGNAEWLVDIANMALLMFEEQVHPNFHFNAVDEGEDAYHDRIIQK